MKISCPVFINLFFLSAVLSACTLPAPDTNAPTPPNNEISYVLNENLSSSDIGIFELYSDGSKVGCTALTKNAPKVLAVSDFKNYAISLGLAPSLFDFSSTSRDVQVPVSIGKTTLERKVVLSKNLAVLTLSIAEFERITNLEPFNVNGIRIHHYDLAKLYKKAADCADAGT